MKKYGKIVNGEFIAANPQRIPLPDDRGYTVKWISDEDLASGEYKEVVTTADVTPQVLALARAGRVKLVYKDIGDYIVCSVK